MGAFMTTGANLASTEGTGAGLTCTVSSVGVRWERRDDIRCFSRCVDLERRERLLDFRRGVCIRLRESDGWMVASELLNETTGSEGLLI